MVPQPSTSSISLIMSVVPILINIETCFSNVLPKLQIKLQFIPVSHQWKPRSIEMLLHTRVYCYPISSQQKSLYCFQTGRQSNSKTILKICFPYFSCDINCLSLEFLHNRAWVKHYCVDFLFKSCNLRSVRVRWREVKQGEMGSNANAALLSCFTCCNEAGERYSPSLSLNRKMGSTHGAS